METEGGFNVGDTPLPKIGYLKSQNIRREGAGGIGGWQIVSVSGLKRFQSCNTCELVGCCLLQTPHHVLLVLTLRHLHQYLPLVYLLLLTPSRNRPATV